MTRLDALEAVIMSKHVGSCPQCGRRNRLSLTKYDLVRGPELVQPPGMWQPTYTYHGSTTTYLLYEVVCTACGYVFDTKKLVHGITADETGITDIQFDVEEAPRPGESKWPFKVINGDA